jgi:peptidyl-tRNA hydrolase
MPNAKYKQNCHNTAYWKANDLAERKLYLTDEDQNVQENQERAIKQKTGLLYINP